MDHGKGLQLKDYCPFPYAIPQVDLSVSLGSQHPNENKADAPAPEATRMSTRLTVVSPTSGGLGASLFLDGDRNAFRGLKLDGKALPDEAYRLCARGLTLLSPPAPPFTLEIATQLEPWSNTTALGLFGNEGVIATQCEPHGFSRMTFFPDRPDVLSRYRVRLEGCAKAFPVLLSNGNLIDSGRHGGRGYALWEDPYLKPCYLFALVAGALGLVRDEIVSAKGKGVRLEIWGVPSRIKSARFALSSLKRAIRWDERVFGRAYDLERFMIAAVPGFIGAMENTGLNIFNENLIYADRESATDAAYERVESVVAHEYFHHWSGNRVTCRDWFQLSLKEGFTVFRDQEFTSDLRSRAFKRVSDANLIRREQWPEDLGPFAHAPRPDRAGSIDNLYTRTVYEKGAEIVRMVAVYLGEKRFRRGTDLYFSRHEGEAVRVEEFIKALGDANGTDLSSFMDWYTEAGTPVVEVRRRVCRAQGRCTLTLTPKAARGPRASRKVGKPIPLRLKVYDGSSARRLRLPSGLPERSGSEVVLLRGKAVEVLFPSGERPPVPALLRGFSAPVQVQDDLTTSERLLLATADSDPYTRYESLRRVLETSVVAMMRSPRRSHEPALAAIERAARLVGDLLAGGGGEARALADLCALEVSLSDYALVTSGQVKVGRFLRVAQQVRRLWSASLAPAALNAYQGLAPPAKTYAPTPRQIGDRALRLSLLLILARTGAPEHLKTVKEVFDGASNFTMRLGSLRILCETDSERREGALAAFRAQAGSAPLLFDAWASSVARLSDREAIDRIKKAMKDPMFTMKNPNRVIALLGAFAYGNPGLLHRSDLSGYGFLLEQVARLDGITPQLSARFLQVLGLYERLEPRRRDAIFPSLKALARRKATSAQLRDVLERMCGGAL